MFCGKCGRKLEDGMQACPICDVEKEKKSDNAFQKSKRKSQKLIVIFSLLTLTFTICSIVFSISASRQAEYLPEVKQQYMITKEGWEMNQKYLSHKDDVSEFIRIGNLLADSYGNTDYICLDNILDLDASLERLEELSSELSKAYNNDNYLNFTQDIKDLRQLCISYCYMTDSYERISTESNIRRDSAVLSININNLYNFEPYCRYFGYTDEALQESTTWLENARANYAKYVVVAITFALLTLGSGIVLIVSLKKSKKDKNQQRNT